MGMSRVRSKQVGRDRVDNYAILVDMDRISSSRDILDLRYTYDEEGKLIEVSTYYKVLVKPKKRRRRVKR